VGTSTTIPLSGATWGGFAARRGRKTNPKWPATESISLRATYFDAMASVCSRDGHSPTRTTPWRSVGAVINQQLADVLLPGQDALVR